VAQPLPQNQPLIDVLNTYGVTEKELKLILADGADEAERLIPKYIEKHTTSGKIRAGQLSLVLKEVRLMQAALWGNLGPEFTQGVQSAVLAAAAGEDMLTKFLKQRNYSIPALLSAERNKAKAGLSAVLAKARNNIPLSTQVYRTQAMATGMVTRKVNTGLLLGKTAKDIARDVAKLIKPNVAGGVSYAAFRLARTEINNAYKTAQEARHQDEPWNKGMRWNLSKSHPDRDECDDYAEADDYDLGAGVYPFGKRPLSHPNCLCYLTVETIEEDEFIDAFLRGDYNRTVDAKAYEWADKKDLPCQ
jgi:hypothetical protein